MHIIYTSLLYLALPFVFIKLALRGFRASAYWHDWAERLGYGSRLDAPRVIWVHAVSFGEVQAALPILARLRATYPGYRLVVTTTTPTGRARARTTLGDDVVIRYLPYDLPGAVKRFLTETHPQLAVIMETELWPNLFRACQRRQIPLVVANARLSARSADGYRKVAPFTRQTLTYASLIAAQGVDDRRRFIELGATDDQVVVTGTVKFDIAVPQEITAASHDWRQGTGKRSVWIAASTHEGEEEIVLRAHHRLLEDDPGLLLVLVPRHPERFARAAELCVKEKLSVCRLSEQAVPPAQIQVFLVDAMGQLLKFFAAADVAFMGGSFVNVGGHNMLEPAAVGVPVITGPQTFNFTEVTRLLLEAGAARQLTYPDELASVVSLWLKNEEQRRKAGEQGRRVVAAHSGATDRLLRIIGNYLAI